MEFTYEQLLDLSNEEMREAAENEDSAIQLFKALCKWKEHYLDESDKALRQGKVELGEEHTAKCKALNPKVDMLKAYINEYKINVGAEGTIYKNEGNNCGACKCPVAFYQVLTIKKNYNQRVMDYGTAGMKFTVGKKTLWALHYVKVGNNVIISGKGNAVVHDESCD